MKTLQRLGVLLLSVLMIGGAWAQERMAVRGNAAVSQSGAFTYSIPIRVPPGVSGVEPRLSLEYSSHGPNGLLGLGWNLSGLSSITRCPRTIAQDGVKGAVEYALTDRYCLDGQRLIVKKGTDGADLSEYGTEIESFRRVVAHTAAANANGPAYFIVNDKDGNTYEYGNTADSRVEGVVVSGTPSTAVAVWSLNKVMDPFGNYMTISYAEDTVNGETYPISIAYTANDKTAPKLAAVAAISLEYEARSDSVKKYQAGRVFSRTKRLVKIKASISGAPSFEYRLAYQSTDSALASKIATIAECGSDGTCLPYTSVQWGSEMAAPTLTTNKVPNASTSSGMTWMGDFNGDGKMDIASLKDGILYVYLTDPGPGVTTMTEKIWSVPNNWGPKEYTWVGDFNGDGKSDIATKVGNNIYVNISSGTGFSQQVWPVSSDWGPGSSTYVADFDGDGRSDIVTVTSTAIYKRLSTGSAFLPAQVWTPATGEFLPVVPSLVHLGDFNGDGRLDIIAMPFSGGTAKLWLSTDGGFKYAQWDTTDSLGGKVWIGDVNGDGLADLLIANRIKTNYQWDYPCLDLQAGMQTTCTVNNGLSSTTSDSVRVYLSTGTGWAAPQTWPAKMNFDLGSTYKSCLSTSPDYQTCLSAAAVPTEWVGDFNGDGKIDVILESNAGIVAYYSNGNSFTQKILPYPIGTSIGFDQYHYAGTGDFSGDGNVDFVTMSEGALYVSVLPSLGSPWSGTASIGTGLGSTVTPTYMSLSDAAGVSYFGGKSVSYPLIASANIGRKVTTSVSTSGQGVTRNGVRQFPWNSIKNYSYGTAVSELGTGRGLLGFEWVQSTNLDTGIVERKNLNQTFPYVGAVDAAGIGTTATSWNSVSLTNNTYGCFDPAGGPAVACTVGPAKRYFVYQKESVLKRNDLDGTAMPGSKTTNLALDAYGNVTQSQTQILNADGSNSEYLTEVTKTFYNDPLNWYLGRPLTVSTKATGPTLPSVVVPGSGLASLPPTPAPKLPPQLLMPILNLLLDD